MQDEVVYRRRWSCRVAESGYSVSSRCKPSDPHDPVSWGCQFVLSGPTFKDNAAARQLLADKGIEVLED